MGLLGSWESDPAAAHCARYGAYGLILADNTLMQYAFQLQQPFAFLFLQLAHRNFGPHATTPAMSLGDLLPS